MECANIHTNVTPSEERAVMKQDWIGRYAQVKEPETPGLGPEGLVSYPAGIGGFIRRLDQKGRAIVQLTHFYGRFNSNLAAYGEVAFRLASLHIGNGVQAWGGDDRQDPAPHR